MSIIEHIPGLTQTTENLYPKISKLNCIKPLYLCGGTSISLQLNHRLSEDLDFELIGTKKERPDLAFGDIITEISSEFDNVKKDILGDDHFLLTLPGNVKLSFFKPQNPVPYINKGYQFNNILTPSIQDLLGMKIYTISVRNTYRDYYDIYSLLQKGLDFKQGIDYALSFSKHSIHTKDILTTLITPQLFPKETDFNKRLRPKYDVSSEEICIYIKQEIEKLGEKTKSKIKKNIQLENNNIPKP